MRARLDAKTLEALAELICGDDGPVYRKGWELPGFFKRAGLECPDHDGSTRKWWTLDRLREYQEVPRALERVILRLADPKEYAGDGETAGEVVRRLNRILRVEGLEVVLEGAKPRVRGAKPGAVLAGAGAGTPVAMPDFKHLIGDSKLADTLAARWQEAERCVAAGAHLAGIVMMGSLLEGLLIAVVRLRPAEANRARSAPRDPRSGRAWPFQRWSLHDLIKVAHECGWLQRDAKDFSDRLRDYRNLVHPWQQRSMMVVPDEDTCAIGWQVVRAAVNDLAAALREMVSKAGGS